jgi:hypothetical protein
MNFLQTSHLSMSVSIGQAFSQSQSVSRASDSHRFKFLVRLMCRLSMVVGGRSCWAQLTAQHDTIRNISHPRLRSRTPHTRTKRFSRHQRKCILPVGCLPGG